MKYNFEMELDESTSVGKIAARIKSNANILEFGPGNGRMTRYLIEEKQCKVSIVELDKELYDFVSEFATNGFFGNIEDFSWVEYFAGEQFDYIIFADVLEHLMNPKKVLEKVKDFLKEDGEILITFPNIAHNSVLIDLFNNKLNWNEYGLLDKTHKSFFTQSGFEKLFNELDLYIAKEDFTINQVGYNEIINSYDDLPIASRADFKGRPFGEVYQYFYCLSTKTVENPERIIPENSSYLKECHVLYEHTDETEEFDIMINNETGENKTFKLEVPVSLKKIKLFPSKQGLITNLKIELNNQLVTDIVTNAVYSKNNEYYFFNEDQVPVIEILDQNIIGQTIEITIDYLYEGQYSENIHSLIEFAVEKREEAHSLKETLDKLKVLENELQEKDSILKAIKSNYEELSKSEVWTTASRKKGNATKIADKVPLENLVSMTIDDISKNSETKMVTIRGWGYDQENKEPLKFVLEANEALYYRVNSEYRRDVIDMFELSGASDYGFVIEIYDITNRTDYHLTIETSIGKKADLVANVFIPGVEESVFKRSLNSIKNRGLLGSAKWYLKRKKEIIEPEENSEEILKEIEMFTFNPLISVVVPVYNVEEKWLEACVSSLQNQYYQNWELCLADDASPKSYIRPLLEQYMAKDSRIKVIFREVNGHISEATNSGLEIASGDYIGFMDNDDELAPRALYEVVKSLNFDQSIDFIYTDEDKITENGKRFNAFYKSEWNAELLLSHNYITHFVVIKKELLSQIGGLNTDFNGSQDYDFVLRATEKAKNVKHISGIMYHWRAIESSTALNPESKNYAYVAGQRAVEAAVKRRGLNAKVEIGEFYGSYKINYQYPTNPKVSIVVFNENKKLNDSIQRLLEKTDYENIEVVIADKYKSQVTSVSNKLLFAKGNTINELVSTANGEYVVLFNQDLEPISKLWLNELMNFAQKDAVGAVCSKILDDRYRVVNIGIGLNPEAGRVTYPEQGTPGKSIGYYYRIALPRNVQASTIDCLIFRKVDFEEVGGLDEQFGDELAGIDLSLKITNRLKKSIVYCSYSTLKIHQAPKVLEHKKVFEELTTKWSLTEMTDPYRNPRHN